MYTKWKKNYVIAENETETSVSICLHKHNTIGLLQIFIISVRRHCIPI